MMKASGSFTVPATSGAVAALVTDLEQLVKCIPGFDSVVEAEAGQLTVRVKVGVGAIKGSMNTKVGVIERLPAGVRFRGNAGGLGSAVDVLAGFDWQEGEGGTFVEWTGEAQSSGKLASLARGLMESVARKNVETLIGNVRRTLDPT
jgi:carbon monoxide dehydrogenase subunit G